MKYQGKFRVESTRLPDWNYADPGYYFVTICCHNHQSRFGEIIDDEIRLYPIGIIACDRWREIPQHFPNVELDAFVIMPNHIHGIIIIIENNHRLKQGRDAACCVSTVDDDGSPHDVKMKPADLQKSSRPTDHIGPGSLGAIIRSYKSAVTKQAHESGFEHFRWQSRYYDHLIETETALQSVRDYIEANPANWQHDEENR